jgi:uncharacterized protein YbjQ (UPF0145 family)
MGGPATGGATRVGSVVLAPGGDSGCDGEAIGVVDAPFAYGDEAGSRRALAAAAAKMDADVVIDVRHVTSGTDEHLLGTAVRCGAMKDPRPYDVLGEIDVPEVEEGPDAAFALLRARAYEMSADLVVDVRLARDDAEHAHVRGTAIKYR